MEINKIHNTDCIKGMKTEIDENSVDVIITSPPYNIGIKYNSHKELLKKECENSIILGISAMTNQAYRGLQISEFVKKIYPKICVVWGGIHGTLFPEDTCENPNIDFIVMGEGEITFSELLNNLGKSKNYSKIDGLAYKSGKKVYVTKKRALIDMSKMAIPDWDIVDEFVKENIYQYFWGDNLKFTEVHTGRGCPHRCNFCIDSILYGKTWRPRKVDSILDEIEMLIKRYNIDLIELRDENFFVDLKRVEEFCDKKIKRGINIKWGASIRADYFERIDDNFMKKLKDSNCYRFWFGAESGSQRILDLIKKDVKLSSLYKSAHMSKKYGIMPLYSFMIGQPGETKEEMKQTVVLIKNLININKRTGILGPQILRPYPGCEMFDMCVKEGFESPKKLEEWRDLDRISLYYLSTDSLPWIKDKEFVEVVAYYTPKAFNMSYLVGINFFWKLLFGLRSKLFQFGLFAFMGTSEKSLMRILLKEYLKIIDQSSDIGKGFVKRFTKILKYSA